MMDRWMIIAWILIVSGWAFLSFMDGNLLWIGQVCLVITLLSELFVEYLIKSDTQKQTSSVTKEKNASLSDK